MARLVWVFLVILLAYQCVDVVYGAVEEKDLPNFVGNKKDLLERLKKLCDSRYHTRIVASADLRHCTITCARGVFNGLFGASDTVTLNGYEPCDWNAQCMDGQGCVYIA
uniref:Putative ixodes 8-cys protein n=1 Tax=Ixodes ricinus TaxID=34613 RepID=A0A0K8RMD4_IXORI